MKSKRNLYIFFSIVCITLITFSKIFITNNLFLLKEAFSNDIFIDKDIAFNNIMKSVYFNNLNKVNLKARDCNNLNECKEIYKNNLINFTEKEKNEILDLIKSADEKLIKLGERMEILHNFNKIPWKIARTTDKIENGFPFTIGNIIYISNRFMNKNNERDKIITLIHEKLHIYQRKYPKETEDLYKQFNFYKVAKKDYPMRRENPDLDNNDYEYKGIKFYKKFNKNPKDLLDSYTEYMPNNSNNINELKNMKYTDEHPNEIFANMISNEIVKGELDNRILNYLN